MITSIPRQGNLHNSITCRDALHASPTASVMMISPLLTQAQRSGLTLKTLSELLQFQQHLPAFILCSELAVRTGKPNLFLLKCFDHLFRGGIEIAVNGTFVFPMTQKGLKRFHRIRLCGTYTRIQRRCGIQQIVVHNTVHRQVGTIFRIQCFLQIHDQLPPFGLFNRFRGLLQRRVYIIIGSAVTCEAKSN